MDDFDSAFRTRFKRVPTVEDEDFLAQFFTPNLKTEETALVPVSQGRSVTELVEGINEVRSLGDFPPVAEGEVSRGFDALDQHYKQQEKQRVELKAKRRKGAVYTGLCVSAACAVVGLFAAVTSSSKTTGLPPPVSAPVIETPMAVSPLAPEKLKVEAPKDGIKTLDSILDNLDKKPAVEYDLSGDVDLESSVLFYEKTRDDAHYHMTVEYFGSKKNQIFKVNLYASFGKNEFRNGVYDVRITDWLGDGIFKEGGQVEIRDGTGPTYYSFRLGELHTIKEKVVFSKAEEILQKYYAFYPEIFSKGK